MDHIDSLNADFFQETRLLAWFISNTSMDKKSHAQQSVRWNHSTIPKLQRWNRWSLGMDK